MCIAVNVGLDHSELVLAGAEQAGVLGGAAGSVNGEVGAGLLVDNGADRVTEVVVVAGSGAGTHQVAASETDIFRLIAVGGGIVLGAAGSKAEHHNAGKEHCKKLLHNYILPFLFARRFIQRTFECLSYHRTKINQ